MAQVSPISLRSAKGASSTPPVSPVTGGFYIVLGAATGAWSGQSHKIAYYTGSAYEFISPNVHTLLFTEDTNDLYVWNTTSSQWIIPNATSAGGSGANTALSNLVSVSINDDLLFQTGQDIGSATNPPRDLFLYGSGTYGTHSLRFTGTPSGNRVLTFPDATTNIVGHDTTDTLTNKTINGSNNTLSNITEAMLSFSDITTLNSSTTQHGFLKKLSNSATQYMDGTGNWSTPSGTSLTVQDIDGTPTATGVSIIRFTNGSVTDDGGGQVTITISAGSGATTALDNLASVNINSALLAQTGIDLGSTIKPFRDLYLYGSGTYGTHSMQFTGTPSGTRVFTFPDATTNIVGHDTTQTLTNKTISGGSNTISGITETMLSFSDITTLNSSTSQHGLLKKLSNVATEYMDGTGNWSSVSASSAATTTASIANDTTTGTTTSRLAKLSGAPSKAIVATTSDTGGFLGIVTSGAGTSGNATITTMGLVSAEFDGATTAGNFVIASTTTGGQVHDIGSTYPTSGQILGRVLSTNVGAGTYQMFLYPPDIRGTVGGSGVSGSGTTNRIAKWSSSSAIDASGKIREASSKVGFHLTSDPTTAGTANNSADVAIMDFPTSGGSTINYGNWNSTGFAIPFVVHPVAATNGGNSMVAPFPAIVMGIHGVGGQSFATTAALALNRYTTASNQSNGRLSIQVNNASNEYPTDVMGFYGNGRAGLNNGSTSTSANEPKARFHINAQLTNSGSSFSTTSWNSQGLVPLLAVWDDQDAASSQTHPAIIMAKKGVAAGQESQRVEFGLGRWENSSNAPRTRFDIRLAHATNETKGVRIASFMSYGGLGILQTDGVDPTQNNPEAMFQVGETPDNAGSYSLSNWNSTSQRLRSIVVTPTTNGGSSPAASEPGLVLARRGVSGQAYSNYVEFKVSRWENNGINARSSLSIAATHAGGDASGTDIVEFRSDKNTNFKGVYGGQRTTASGSGSQTLDWTATNTMERTLSGNSTFSFSNMRAGYEYTLVIIQAAGGGNTVAFGSNIKLAGGAYTMTATASKIDILRFYYDGTDAIESSRSQNM